MYSEEHEDPLYTKLSKILELTSLIFGHYKETGQKERAHSLIVWVVSALQAVIENRQKLYVSLCLHVQNGVSRLISALCVNCLISIPCTMHKLSECYSGIFQTQSSGCVSGLDHFRNFTNLKILNI